MQLGDILEFRKDLYFEGAVQADWFYNKEKAAKVAENFVFHGNEYFGVEDESTGKKRIDTISLVKEIAKKFSYEERNNPFSLAIADYGTGKSHLALTLAQIFSGPEYMPNTYKKILNNISLIDTSAVSIIEKLCDGKNFVMVINGMRDFNLHYEILNAAQKSLKLYGLSDENLRKLNRALDTAELFFERNAEAFIDLFEKYAEQLGWIEKKLVLIEKIHNQILTSETAFNIINAVYEEVNGQEIRWDEGISASTILEMLVSEYCGVSGRFDHIVIIFDEFGRYLEYASGVNSAKSGDSALQQIFEATQNADGIIQVINFIQSDIKTYLQRVDQTKNISRYIGRYDVSDKYYISSNLETVFANLIYRKDRNAFDKSIRQWQKDHEDIWRNIFDNMSRWLPIKGVWKEYDLFRQVIVEGIYPMHPLSTYMLTQLSDYLQNRSSLTLISRYISDYSSCNIENNIPLVLPETLLSGDLYIEMLSAEQEGRQLSQHCIRFDNILRKYGDKISDDSLKLLRANLAMRILRFRTKDYEDAKNAIMICSGLSQEKIVTELYLLETEYALLGFDEHAGCFDFLEETNGAHDFKMLLKRMKVNTNVQYSIFQNLNIMEIAGTINPQPTNFAAVNKIKTNEWLFKQELFAVEELTENLVDSYINDWKEAVGSNINKGRLVWLYMNKDSELESLDNAFRLSSKIQDMPIVFMLLNDDDNKLHNSLLDYIVLNEMNESDRRKYERHYSDYYLQAEINLRSEFELLKKKREKIAPSGIVKLEDRLGQSLTNVFQMIYPCVLSFCFDGFDTKKAGAAKKYFCSILKMLLSNSVNYNTIHNFQSDVRNRIEAVLMTSSSTSWKSINEQCQIIPPEDYRAKVVYDKMLGDINKNKEVECKLLYNEYCKPPYGMSEDIVTLMIAILCANMNYCLRFRYDNGLLSVQNWKDYVVVKDTKIDIDIIKKSSIVMVDAGVVSERFIKLFVRIEGNKQLGLVIELERELGRLLKIDEIPEELNTRYMLAKKILDDGHKILCKWENIILIIDEKYGESLDSNDVYKALTALKDLEALPISEIFIENGYIFSEKFKNEILELRGKLINFAEPQLEKWIMDQRCKSVEAITQFGKHIERVVNLLNELGYSRHADLARKHGDKELDNREEIKSRQDLREDCHKYTESCNLDRYTSYLQISNNLKEGREILERIEKYYYSFGNDADKIKNAISKRVEEFQKASERIKQDMGDIWDGLYETKCIEDARDLVECIKMVLQKGIPNKDQSDFIELKDILVTFIENIESLKDYKERRIEFNEKYIEIKKIYTEQDMDFDVLPILEDIKVSILKEMDEKERNWRCRFLSLSDKNRNTVLKWKDDTCILPQYLTEETLKLYNDLMLESERILSKAKIGDVAYYFDKLDTTEKITCIETLNSML